MTPSEFESKWRGIFHIMRQGLTIEDSTIPVAKMPLPWREAMRVKMTRAVCRFYHTQLTTLRGPSALLTVAHARRVLCVLLCHKLGFLPTETGAYLHKTGKQVQQYVSQGSLPHYQPVIHKILTDAGVNDGVNGRDDPPGDGGRMAG